MSCLGEQINQSALGEISRIDIGPGEDKEDHMKHMTTYIKGLTIAGVVLGLGIQAVGSSGQQGEKKPQLTKGPAAVVIEDNLPPVDRQLVQVSDDKQTASSREEGLYRPPPRGAPGGRVGGGTRGPMNDLPLLLALVPDHVGLSSEVQPRLVWYLSKATAYPVEFTLINEKEVTPLVEKRLSSPTESGIHIISLADYDLKLEKGKTYQWFVSLISDPEHRAADIIGGGMIEVGDVTASLREGLRNANSIEATRLWAQAGFWYDALSIISTNIQANPSNPEMHHLRASLLEAVDLNTPAQADRLYGL